MGIGDLERDVEAEPGRGEGPVTPVALLELLSPIVVATLGAVALGETFGLVQGAGFAMALTAIVAGQLSPRPQRTDEDRPTRRRRRDHVTV